MGPAVLINRYQRNADSRVERLESDRYDEVLTVPFADRQRTIDNLRRPATLYLQESETCLPDRCLV